MTDPMYDKPLDGKYREAARYIYGCDDVVISDCAHVTYDKDRGAYVQAWLWVPADRVRVKA